MGWKSLEGFVPDYVLYLCAVPLAARSQMAPQVVLLDGVVAVLHRSIVPLVVCQQTVMNVASGEGKCWHHRLYASLIDSIMPTSHEPQQPHFGHC